MACIRTYATLRIFSDDLTPADISRELQIKCTNCFLKGDVYGQGRLRRECHGWFFDTEGMSDSCDDQYHLGFILGYLRGKEAALAQLRQHGCEMDLRNFYESTNQGGPMIRPEQAGQLSALGLAVFWDIYFAEEDED